MIKFGRRNLLNPRLSRNEALDATAEVVMDLKNGRITHSQPQHP
jgi:hypothetical protein